MAPQKQALSSACRFLKASTSGVYRQQQRSIASSTIRHAEAKPSSQPQENERVVFSGIQPTGVPHLGNYLGALKEWVRLQDEADPSTKLIFSVADLHALTIPQQPDLLYQWRKEAMATLMAVGLDPKRSILFYQSSVPAHSELMWILSTVSSVGYLSRMTQWKSKLSIPDSSTLEDSTARAKLRLGLFSYPVLQAADILVHRATDIPVGEDQRQHIEFTRGVANSFNYLHGNVFPIPSTLISSSKRVMSLKEPQSKMSKSHPDHMSRILLTDCDEDIKLKLRKALTDSEPNITFDRENRPGVSNLIEILAHIEGVSPQDIVAEFHDTNLGVFKAHVAEKVAAHLKPIRERYMTFIGEGISTKYLDDTAEHGARRARRNAEITMRSVRDALGL